MKDRDWKRFGELMQTTAEYYRVAPLSKRAMRMAFDLLRDLSIEQVEIGLTIHASGIDGNSGRYCPNAADIRLALSGTIEQRAIMAWATVRRALLKGLYWQSVRFDDPCIHFALENSNAWVERTTPDMERRFIRTYMAAVSRMIGWNDVQDYLGYKEENVSPEQIVTVKTIGSISQIMPSLTISQITD